MHEHTKAKKVHHHKFQIANQYIYITQANLVQKKENSVRVKKTRRDDEWREEKEWMSELENCK